jgi:hypothetical protein
MGKIESNHIEFLLWKTNPRQIEEDKIDWNRCFFLLELVKSTPQTPLMASVHIFLGHSSIINKQP